LLTGDGDFKDLSNAKLLKCTVDAIIYCSAMEKEAVFVTGDNDFRGLPNIEILKL